MNICKIQIEKYLGIKSLSLSIDSDFQVIAGPNNACKSTVLMAINTFFSGFEIHKKESYAPQNSYYTKER